jgi:hypothetical protein
VLHEHQIKEAGSLVKTLERDLAEGDAEIQQYCHEPAAAHAVVELVMPMMAW